MTSVTLSISHVALNAALITLSHVAFVGKLAVTWEYLMICCVLGSSYTLFIIRCWLLIVIACGVGVKLGGAVCSSIIGILHNHCAGSLHPRRMGCSVLANIAFLSPKFLLCLL